MIRDIRDPATLGQAILDTKKRYPHLTASQVADGQTGVPFRLSSSNDGSSCVNMTKPNGNSSH